MTTNVKDQSIVFMFPDTFYATAEGKLTIQNTFIHSIKSFSEKEEVLDRKAKYTLFELTVLLSALPVKGNHKFQWESILDDISGICVQDEDLNAAEKFKIYRHCETLASIALAEEAFCKNLEQQLSTASFKVG